MRLRGALDRAALGAALDRVVARHEILRTRFVAVDGQPVQAIDGPDRGFPLDEADLRELPGHEQEAAVARAALDHAVAPFDLARGPLVRGRLLRLADDDHVLLVNQHHIVSDGWSIRLFVDEVSRAYASLASGRPDARPLPALQYADYAAWQRAEAEGERWRAQAAWWTERLRGAPELLALPTDRPRPARPSYAGGTVRTTIDATMGLGLKALGRRHGATLFMTLLAGWALVLARHSGQDEVVIGSPVANRPRAELEGVIGFFANLLALRVPVDASRTVAQLLAAVRRDTLEAYGRQDLPFEQVVDAVKPPRSLAHAPLCQAVLTLTNADGPPTLALPGLAATALASPDAAVAAKFDLQLSVMEGADGELDLELLYATDLFGAATARRWLDAFACVLQGLAADADVDDVEVGALRLMDERREQELLRATNAQARDFPSTRTVHALVSAQAAARPDATALTFEARSLSFRELEASANRVARRLVALGVRPHDRVAVCMTRGLELVVGLLAVLKCGAAYVPLDPIYPADRLAHMLDDSAPAVLLTQASLSHALPAHDVPELRLDDLAAFADECAEDPGIEVASDALAYVIYTSGSTGRPKGVMVEHRQVTRLLAATDGWFGFRPDDTWTLFHSYAFDFSVWEIWGALAFGGRLVVVPSDVARSAPDFFELLCRERVTVLNQTPSAFRQLIAAQARSASTHALREVIFGGEALEFASLRDWVRRHGVQRPRLVNMYGITETTVHVTCHVLSEADVEAGTSSVIGAAIPDLRLYLLDAHRRPVPVGVIGEMFVGGAGVARGYLNRPELTAERFVDDPFAGERGARMYRTGDLGRWRADGTMEYLGRNDFQVKIRGFRIELGEIEARLLACAGVREAAVVASKDGAGDPRLVAYLVVDASLDLDPASLRAALATALPAYMVPAAFVRLDAFPLTPNGKLDRAALQAPDQEAVVARAYEAPRGETEAALAEAWQALLGLDRVGRHDHFFELGGHSLQVIEMIDRLRARGWELPVQQVFVDATLRTLAEGARRVEETTAAAHATRLALDDGLKDALAAHVPGGAANVEDAYPLTALQQGLLFHSLLDTEGDPYLLRSILAFDSRARLDAFVGALRHVVARHDSLRTAIFWEGLAEPVQVVCREVALPLHEHVEASRDGDADDALAQLGALTDPRRLRLDLHRAPLMACHAMHDAANGEWLLAILSHHLVTDHVSLERMLDEIEQVLRGRGDALPPAARFADHVERADATARANAEAAHRKYFTAQLAHIDAPTAPFDLLDVQGRGARGDAASRTLAHGLASRLREVARAHGVSPAVLFHVAWARVLGLCTGQDEVVFGTVLSGRLQGAAGIGQVVGLLVNTLPVRVALEATQVDAMMRHVQAQLRDLVVHERAPLLLAQKCSGVAPGLPLFTSTLNHRHSHASARGADSALGQGMRQVLSEEATNFPVRAVVDDLGDGFVLTVQCQGAHASRLEAYWHRALMQLAGGEADGPHASLLPAEERRRLLEDFQPRDAAPARAARFERLLLEQARRTPEAPAVAFGDRTLTCRELDARANALAHVLVARGVRPDDRVAMCLDRGVAQLLALVAIHRAGAGYVPLDPSQPASRLRELLDDAAPRVLLLDADEVAVAVDGVVPTLALSSFVEGALASLGDLSPPVVEGASPDHLAYVIYTSGSTGRPKGVMVEHRSVVHLFDALAATAYAHLAPASRVAVNASLTFDASVKALVQLLAGHALHIVPAAVRADAPAMLAWLKARRIDALDVTPLQLAGLCRAGLLEDPALAHLTVVIGGEAIPDGLWRALRASPLRAFNVYGPTECTVDATIADLRASCDLPHIGRPIPRARVHLLDRHGELVPVGAVGELHIGGAGVARGYLGRPELTAERFVADPFDDATGARLYRTGDLGRWREDGTIEFLGRNDFQVKVRGFRIELGEIEAALARCEGVREAVVLARPDEDGDARLVAYLVGEEGLGAAALRSALAASLPEYMLPSAFVRLDRFPLTPNGKLDRRALPAPDASAVAARAYEAPQGEVEEALAAIWRELLGLADVGRNDHFFELGGHSLLAVKLHLRVGEAFDVAPGLRDVLSHLVLRQLADLVTRLQLELYAREDTDSIDLELQDLSEAELLAMLAGGQEP
jgi:amino acid adenylation domain-containing protein